MIIEIVHYYFNQKTNIISVSFKIDSDSEEYVRQDEFNVDEILDYGFQIVNQDIISDDFQLFDDIEDFVFESEDSSFEPEIDSMELRLFLIEYYTLNPSKIPKSELF
jgi:hypothetical protein